MALYALGVIAVFFIGMPLQKRGIFGGLLVTEWLLLGAGTLLFLRAQRVHLAGALLWRRPGPRHLTAALLLALSAGVVVNSLVAMTEKHLGGGVHQFLEDFQRLLFPPGVKRPLAADLLFLAVTPAVCEELLFRGAILSGLRGTLGARWAVGLQAVLFGVFHFSPYRFLPTALLGLALGYLAVASRSILPGMIFHALNNALAIVVLRSGATDLLDPATPGGTRILVASLLVSLAGLMLARPRPHQEVPSPAPPARRRS
jgi:sodium transport system permease protein